MIAPRLRGGPLALVLVLVLAPAMARAEPAPAPAAAPVAPATPAEPPAATTPAPAVMSVKDAEGEPRLSLPTETDRDAWLRAGFRLALGFTYGRVVGIDGAPGGRLIGAAVRFGLRLDASWSILSSFQYGDASSKSSLYGLRFMGTIDPTWHATRHLALAVGLGFGGLVGGNHGPDIPPQPSTLGASYTFPSPSPSLPTCSGVGAAGLVRAEWSWVLGPRSATGLGLELDGQWTGCVDDTGLVEADTGQAIVRRQWWPQLGLTGTWSVTWR
jgi:hypothetical protein